MSIFDADYTERQREQCRQPTPAEKIGARLRALREARGWSTPEMAARVQSHRPVVSRIEGGAYHLPTLTTILAYAKALGVQPSEILCVLDEPEAP